MVSIIRRDTVVQLMQDDNAQLLDVLAGEEYDEDHIAGAINLPLKQLRPDTANSLDRGRPVITYCHDCL
jgi:rhodanese-related sulfurtransferase